MADIVAATRVQLVANGMTLPYLNYQYGNVKELSQTLMEMSKTQESSVKKFPLVWLVQPFTLDRGVIGFYAKAEDLRLFIATGSQANYKAAQRMAITFKPILYPIYRELLNQLDLHVATATGGIENIKHEFTDRYWWGEEDASVLNDVVDCCVISQLELPIYNNANCIPSIHI